MEKETLLVVMYGDNTVTIKTKNPELEVKNAFMKPNLTAIIQDNKIIYARSGRSL